MLIIFRQEALESAISEKDAHLALLEFNSTRSMKQTDVIDKLKADRARLIKRLHEEVSAFPCRCSFRSGFLTTYELGVHDTL